MEINFGDVCVFCTDTRFEDASHGQYEDNDYVDIEDIIQEEINKEYTENPRREEVEHVKQPKNIIVQHGEVDEYRDLVEFIKDILDIEYFKYEPHQDKYQFNVLVKKHFDDSVKLFEAKRKSQYVARPTISTRAPIIMDKQDSSHLWQLIMLLETKYGKHIRRYSLSGKDRADQLARRNNFYRFVWHLGNLYRKGKMADRPSKWITGQQPPIDGDPFPNEPIV
jgi:hypothetical protein